MAWNCGAEADMTLEKFDRFARSTRHLRTAREEFDHLGVRFVSVQHQINGDSPMGRARFTIVGAMAKLESSLIRERVDRRHASVVNEVEELANFTDLTIRAVQTKTADRASRRMAGAITERAKPMQPAGS